MDLGTDDVKVEEEGEEDEEMVIWLDEVME